MQQVGPEAEIWRRASPSPTPRPVLKLAPALARRLPARRLRYPRQARRYLLLLAALGLAQGVTLVRNEHAGTVLAKLETWAQLAGLGLDQATLIGHRYTADTDIFEAIGLKRARTMLSFDPAAAQARLAELPWIQQASLERVFPDRLEVRITERTPVAVWSRGERSFLIDETGRTLAQIPGEVMPELPRVTGEGAASAAAGLFALLAPLPDLKARIASAERVGGRRWTLRLNGGGAIQLPVEGEAQALAQAVGLLATVFGQGEIDVRAAGRAIVREAPRASQAQVNAPARRPTDRL
ncbi:MAG TPA: FtsQ-type POTRA domain-containing protein [Hyphomicrobiaceae bacterium]|nr:FtsQ-type POTRA domain-containing protein [Hyphomicrobiaceae bacterium]